MVGLITHEWLAQSGGSENVFEELLKTFPDAAGLCLWDDSEGRFETYNVDETWLAKSPFRRSKSLAIPLMLIAWRSVKAPAPEIEWLLCSTHLFSHHARLRGASRSIPKFVYAHTPARYIWTPELDQRGASLWLRIASIPLQIIDRQRAKEAVSIASNSRFVAERIERAWRRSSEVIHPPVDVEAVIAADESSLDAASLAILAALPERFVLGASRFVPYKRLDLVIAAGEASGLPVVLAGDGPLAAELRDLAAASTTEVRIVTAPSTALLHMLFKRASVYVFPPVEDFGIMPVEAMAAGTPVIANRVGGSAESITNGSTGVLLGTFSPPQLKAAVDAALTMDPQACIDRSRQFGTERFHREVSAWIGRHTLP